MLKRLQSFFGGSSPQQTTPPPGDAPAASAPGDVTDADFAVRALGAGPLTVVDFWAEWCQPCQVMSAHVEMLARAFGDRLRVLALDVDENPRTAERYRVMGLPTLIFFRDGAEVERITGVGPYESLRRQVERLLAADQAPSSATPQEAHTPVPPAGVAPPAPPRAG
jgi:thioredoxin 1